MSTARRVWRILFKPWELCDPDLLRGELACATAEDCQFPYPNYGEYLRKRGLDHLLPWAQWTGSPDHRSVHVDHVGVPAGRTHRRARGLVAQILDAIAPGELQLMLTSGQASTAAC